jgi:DNA-binding LytR/AlgR family response regulator
MKSKTKICLTGRDELYVVDLENVLYMQADDHYTHIFYSTSHHFLVPYGLSVIEEIIKQKGSDSVELLRLGRKYIINMSRIYHINSVKGNVSLADDEGKNVVLHISKPIIRGVVELLQSDLSLSASSIEE